MEAFVQGGDVTEADPGIYKRLAYHLVMNNFTVPQSLEGLKVESCGSFVNDMHESTAMNRAIANGTAIAEDIRSRMMMARIAEFRLASDSVKMVNAWAVTLHWDKKYLHAAAMKMEKDFVNLGVNFKKMRPRTVAEQIAKAQSLGINVVLPAMERTRFVKLSRNAGSLNSLRSGARH